MHPRQGSGLGTFWPGRMRGVRGVRGVRGLPVPAAGSGFLRHWRWRTSGAAAMSENSAATIGSSTMPARAAMAGPKCRRRPVAGLSREHSSAVMSCQNWAFWRPASLQYAAQTPQACQPCMHAESILPQTARWGALDRKVLGARADHAVGLRALWRGRLLAARLHALQGRRSRAALSECCVLCARMRFGRFGLYDVRRAGRHLGELLAEELVFDRLALTLNTFKASQG